ncbi:signal peptidase I [Chondromyces apiculatus]|uniref:Signal peptidase I n=1 Tax=Chondromyces apiculatus DSM 436 TaxID=1192034 RepID=A0A017T2C6_9BACT|nr:signal peptidase I [Chondromyces apiculatus]EYF02990.1 Signal peptidase I [Chondromyces apiculatus DSM 436]
MRCWWFVACFLFPGLACAPAAPPPSTPGQVMPATPESASVPVPFAGGHAPAGAAMLARVKFDALPNLPFGMGSASQFPWTPYMEGCGLDGRTEIHTLEGGVARSGAFAMALQGTPGAEAVRCVLDAMLGAEGGSPGAAGMPALQVAALPEGAVLVSREGVGAPAVTGGSRSGGGASVDLGAWLAEVDPKAPFAFAAQLAPRDRAPALRFVTGADAVEVRLRFPDASGAAAVRAFFEESFARAAAQGGAGLKEALHLEGAELTLKVAPSVSTAAALREHLVEAFRMPTGSMIPSLIPGDQVLVAKGALAGKAARGDIVVHADVRNPRQRFMKRVLAVGGDRLQIDGYSIRLNGAPVAATLVDGDVTWGGYGGEETQKGAVWRETLDGHAYDTLRTASESDVKVDLTVPPDSVFVVGDNRDNSHDSRHFGALPMSAVVGRVVLVHVSVLDGEIRWERLGILPDAALHAGPGGQR